MQHGVSSLNHRFPRRRNCAGFHGPQATGNFSTVSLIPSNLAHPAACRWWFRRWRRIRHFSNGIMRKGELSPKLSRGRAVGRYQRRQANLATNVPAAVRGNVAVHQVTAIELESCNSILICPLALSSDAHLMVVVSPFCDAPLTRNCTSGDTARLGMR